MNFYIEISPKLNLGKLKLLLTLLIIQVNVLGQTSSPTASIPDPAFKQFLQNNYPEVVDSNERLIIYNAYNITAPINCSNQNIKDLTGIEYFQNMYSLNCSYNQITFLPPLSSFGPNFIYIDCSHNQLSTFPQLNPYNPIKRIDCSFNKIQSLSAFDSVYSIDTLFCNNNNLTFEDLLPIQQKHPSVFIYWPQAPLYVNPKVELSEGATYILKFPYDDTTSSNYYEIFKKANWGGNNMNKPISGNTFIIQQVTISDSGSYFIQAYNKLLPQLILSTIEQRLIVNANTENVFTPNGDNKNDSFYIQCGGSIRIYNRYGQQIKQIEGSNFWDGTDQEGYDAPLGTYIIRCVDSNEIVVTLLR